MTIPIDSGFGNSYGEHDMTKWDPAAAFGAQTALREALGQQVRTDEYAATIERHPAKGDVRVRHLGEPMTVVEYIDTVNQEVATAQANVANFGGPAAVRAYMQTHKLAH